MPLPILPNTAVSEIRRLPRTASAVASSPFTGTQQVQHWGGQWWEFEFDFWAQAGAAGRSLSAFFTALDGPSGQFIFEDPAEENNASVGTPLVNGASQTGNSLITDGWSPSITVLSAGQFIQLGSDTTARLHQVLADATSDGGGNATLSIWPDLRASPTDNDPIEIANPGVRLRLVGDVPAVISPSVNYRFSARAREVI